jgi:hypothetical protein
VGAVGIRFNAKLSTQGESAVSCACRNGHDEVLEVVFELGARVNGTALPAAIRSGSLKCVDQLLQRKVKVDSKLVELATSRGHADVLGRLLRVCTDFGHSWLIARLDGFGDGQRLLEAAGATAATWTKPVLKFLMEKSGRAAEFAGMVPPSEAILSSSGWKRAEFDAVVARLLRDGTATSQLLRVLIERRWAWNGVYGGPFGRCSSAEFANLVIPPDVTKIGNYVYYSCSGLTQVKIPLGVTMVGDHAFGWCSGLTQMEIPSSVRIIGDHAFEGCSRLARLEIAPGLRTIGQWAFAECSGLTLLKIPSSVRTVGYSAFRSCSRLTRVEIPSGLAQKGDCVFAHVAGIEYLTLVGSPLSSSIIAGLRGCLIPTAKVFGAALAGQRFDCFTIAIPE